MTNNEYIKNVLKTESCDLLVVTSRITKDDRIRLLHSAMGICTEGGELLDALKKHFFYGKELDKVNLKEEIGDLLWYIGVMINVLGTSFEEIQERNIKKLKARYGDKFNKKSALKRDLNKERKILEK